MSISYQKIYRDPEAVARGFIRHLSEWISDFGGENFHVALSGGSTPRLLFDMLARDYKEKFPWDMIHFWWGDERCVPPTDDQSNFNMTRQHLLEHIDIPQENIHRIHGEKDPALACNLYEIEIKEHISRKPKWPEFDLVILGLGSDGHTASIFPHQMELLEDPNICVVATHPESDQQRVSLSGHAINHARKITFLLTGSSKQEKYTEISEQKGNYKAYPASYIDPVQGELYWFLDQAAAGVS